ncbi:MAG: acyl-CoA dehydrogenase [Deltaproteobacteria bacterium RIFCSPLOWO2_02_FULL_50_16]|nr:MAG: acyl-CoA dehydrogenase [Deltaproteobacteria bacterium RIFCSPHIGHO2_02_FULL_50_15]OGQ58485.1 MAG: acyl-CoA dehydrogenase [Deltaproteobacteria bacterium RIFCSPLOWO2_02_FULL_50_16]OGQ67989.1 MAG: acyl-CoA dehydrogenase [Deltaproteobacteria bacterium RIFCSPLOWO2_12_FULL_50_11]
MFDYLLSETQLKWREALRDFVKSIPRQMILDMDADKIQFPKEFLQEAGRRNLLGCRYPKKWGGREMDWVSAGVAIEEVGTLGYIFACLFGVGAELVCDAIVLHGTEAQKEKYVKPLLKGEIFAAECLTEPRGGSDFFGTATKAEDKGSYFLMNGQKRFIVGGEAADYFLVYARTDPKADPHEGITCFIVDRGAGVESQYLYGLMGCRGGGASRVVFSNVKVPKENIVGVLNKGVEVFKTMMIPERLGTAMMTIGAARPALEVATTYASRRKAFGQVINQFQGVSFQIAEAAMLLDASRAMAHITAQAVDRGVDPHRVRRMVSETKKFVTESCQKVAHNAMQVMGGIGYTNIFPVERIFRDLRLSSIWTGSNEVMSMIIAHEWNREFLKFKETKKTRDLECDAASATATEEKVYE